MATGRRRPAHPIIASDTDTETDLSAGDNEVIPAVMPERPRSAENFRALASRSQSNEVEEFALAARSKRRRTYSDQESYHSASQ
jgi:hypothetical protein